MNKKIILNAIINYCLILSIWFSFIVSLVLCHFAIKNNLSLMEQINEFNKSFFCEKWLLHLIWLVFSVILAIIEKNDIDSIKK